MNRFGGHVEYTSRFLEAYDELTPAIQKKADRQLQMLAKDMMYPSLRVRKMVNTPHINIFEARVDQKYRITFQISENGILLRAIGTHEIYLRP